MNIKPENVSIPQKKAARPIPSAPQKASNQQKTSDSTESTDDISIPTPEITADDSKIPEPEITAGVSNIPAWEPPAPPPDVDIKGGPKELVTNTVLAIPPFYTMSAREKAKEKEQQALVSKIKESVAQDLEKIKTSAPAQTEKEKTEKEAAEKKEKEEGAKKESDEKEKKEKEINPDILDALSDAFDDNEFKKTITLNIKPTPVSEVIAMIGKIANLDFVIDPDVTGLTGRIKCDKCTVSQILQFICSTNFPRLALIKYFNAWQVMRFEKATKLIELSDQQNFVFKVVNIYNAKFDENFQKKVQDIWDKITVNSTEQEKKRSYIMFDLLGRKVFVYALQRHVEEIFRFIREIDRVVPQVRIDFILVTAKKSYIYQMGFNWSGVYNRQSTLAMRNPRISLAGIGASVSEFPTPDTGFSQSDGKPLNNANLLIDPLNFALNLVETELANPKIKIPFVFGGADLNLRRLNLILNAAETESKIKVLARPSILTNNGETAEMLVGQSIPLTTIIEDSLEGKTRNMTSTGFKDIGTRIKVRPVVNMERKTILLDIWVQDNEITGALGHIIQTTGSLKADMPPVISTLFTNNKVSLRSGQTTVIGGLVRNSVEKKRSSVPFLHRIPILGWFFRAIDNEQLDEEQLIFITPILIDPVF